MLFFVRRRGRGDKVGDHQDYMNMHSTPGQLQQQQGYVEAPTNMYQELPAQGAEKKPVELSSESWR